MSFATLERAVLHEARAVFNNRKLRQKDIIEWTTGEIEKHDGETIVTLPVLGIQVAVGTEHDRRASTAASREKSALDK